MQSPIILNFPRSQSKFAQFLFYYLVFHSSKKLAKHGSRKSDTRWKYLDPYVHIKNQVRNQYILISWLDFSTGKLWISNDFFHWFN